MHQFEKKTKTVVMYVMVNFNNNVLFWQHQ